ncbi:MAG: hypothetical protein ACRYHA_29645, partial [Janthinobacterium lividum]
MLNVVVGLFGLSAFLILPFFWRLGRAVFNATRPGRVWDGGGIAALCLAMIVVLIAAATFEAGWRGDAAGSVGQGAHAFLASRIGSGAATLLAFAIALTVLPWYLGVGWRRVVGAAAALSESLGFGAPGWARAFAAHEPHDTPRRASRQERRQEARAEARAEARETRHETWTPPRGGARATAWSPARGGSGIGASAASHAGEHPGDALPPASSLSSLRPSMPSSTKLVRAGAVARVLGKGTKSEPPVLREPHRGSPVPEGAYDWRRAAAQTAREREEAAARPVTRGAKPWVPASAQRPASVPAERPRPVPLVPPLSPLSPLSTSAGMPLPASGGRAVESRIVTRPLAVPDAAASAPRAAAPPVSARTDPGRRAPAGGLPHPVEERREPAWKTRAPQAGAPVAARPAPSDGSETPPTPWVSIIERPGTAASAATAASMSPRTDAFASTPPAAPAPARAPAWTPVSGAVPVPAAASMATTVTISTAPLVWTPAPAPEPEFAHETTTMLTSAPALAPAPAPTPAFAPAPAPTRAPMPTPAPAPAPAPAPMPIPAPTPAPMPMPAPTPAPMPMPMPAPTPAPTPTPTPTPVTAPITRVPPWEALPERTVPSMPLEAL